MVKASQIQLTNAETKKFMAEIITIARATRKWYWQSLAFIIALATVISTTFQVLGYFRG